MEKYLLNNGNRLVITQDEDPSDPREWDNVWNICVREHRHYKFPNELDYDFDSAAEDAEKLYEQYYIFELDCYIHSWVSFSLAWRWMQCKFDTSKDCWFIAIPKEINSYDQRAWAMSTNQDKWTKQIYTEKEAMDVAEDEIKIYNQYLNWEVYAYSIEEPVIWSATNKEWVVLQKTSWEHIDWCWGYYNRKDILEEHKLLDPKEIN